MTWYVYALRHPTTLDVKYVGISVDPVRRLPAHLSERASAAVKAWVDSLETDPDLFVLEDTEFPEHAKLAEQVWISRFPVGSLLNSSRGGELHSDGRRRRVEFTGFGSRVKSLREKHRLSQRELAKLAGVTSPVVCRIERDVAKHPTAEIAVALASTLQTTVEYLVTGEGAP